MEMTSMQVSISFLGLGMCLLCLLLISERARRFDIDLSARMRMRARVELLSWLDLLAAIAHLLTGGKIVYACICSGAVQLPSG